MNKLTELLNRWAELEPERCSHSINDLIFRHNQGDEVWTGYRDDTAHLVQIAVQQAIEARGLEYMHISSVWSLNGVRYHTVMIRKQDANSWEKKDLVSNAQEEDCTRAHLTAYLQAIEATAEVSHG